jgi:hypothetical protein
MRVRRSSRLLKLPNTSNFTIRPLNDRLLVVLVLRTGVHGRIAPRWGSALCFITKLMTPDVPSGVKRADGFVITSIRSMPEAGVAAGRLRGSCP